MDRRYTGGAGAPVLLLIAAAWLLGGAVPGNADVLSQAAEQEKRTVRRYGLFVGANDGGSDRVRLRYAGSDAKAVAAVLQRAGGLPEEHTILLQDPSPRELVAGLRKVDRRIGRGHGEGRDELVFYYSGHSDERGLLLGGQRLGYQRLREELTSVGADVHIAILDSCSSGAFTRLKGGVRRSPFLFDESTEAAGHAFLTSSSASEAAQESDEIRGSFFTHYLLAALSGAADASRDRRVSLNEAYSFAAEETRSRTEYTMAGPQHPSYDINLTGTGDLVLTDLREGVETITLSAHLSGRISIRDAWQRPVMEMRKDADSEVAIALSPGRYTVTLDDGHVLQHAEVTLFPGGAVMLSGGQFSRAYRSPAISRGGTESHDRSIGSSAGRPAYEGVDIGFVSVRSGGMGGVQLSMIGSIVEGSMEGVQLASVFNITEGRMLGPQIAGVFNMVEGSVLGPQLSGVFNMVEGSLQGPQLAGVFNIADGGRSEGVQMSGVFNIAGNLDGAQLGVVNLAGKVHGMQMGVVNVSEELHGVPIGLVNIAGNGLHHLSTWYDDAGMVNLGFQLGTFYYTFLTAGISARDRDEAFSAGLGMGLEIPLGGFYVDAELYAEHYSAGGGSFDANTHEVFDGRDLPYPAARLSFGRNIGGGKTSFFAGVDMAFHIPGHTPYVEKAMSGTPWSYDYSGKGETMEIYPRWFIGLRL